MKLCELMMMISTITDDVVAICQFLAVLHYDLRSKPGTFTGSFLSMLHAYQKHYYKTFYFDNKYR